jgi:hypothetical protein
LHTFFLGISKKYENKKRLKNNEKLRSEQRPELKPRKKSGGLMISTRNGASHAMIFFVKISE